LYDRSTILTLQPIGEFYNLGMKAIVVILMLCLLNLSCELLFSDSDIDTVKDLFKSKKERQQEKAQKRLFDLYNNTLRWNTSNTSQSSNTSTSTRNCGYCLKDKKDFTLECTQDTTSYCSYSFCTKYDIDFSVRLFYNPCTQYGFANPNSNKCYYGNGSIFPTGTTTKCSNEILTNARSLGLAVTTDSSPPTVTETHPTNVSTLIPRYSPTFIKFSEDMNQDSLSQTNIIVTLGGVEQSILIIKGKDYLNVFPSPAGEAWQIGQTYTVTISTNVMDSFGNPLSNAYSYQFHAE